MDKLRLGWIGAGKMGTPICANLLQAGYALTVCDVDPARVAALTARGAQAAPDPAALARDVDVVLSMVPDDDALRAIAGGKGGLAGALCPDQVFVDLSTVSPAGSAEVAATLAPTGAAYLRAPVSGSTATAAAGMLSIYCSGPQPAFERVRPLLERIGNKITYCGAAEEARVMKLVINMIVIITPAVVGEALALGARSGLGWSQMIDAIGQSVAASPVIGYKADMMKRRDWTPMATVDLVAKDLDLALELGRQCHAPMPITALAQQFNTALQASGDGGLDFFAVLTWPERLAKA
ncbi:MAG: NAD(P)-dependent oxidoreductase [Burkholderiales bacterium]|nr:NAD(P)-dependent oxidoreductase [Burkholderiales bacterium]